MVRRRYHFYGNVQGVGFRYRARYAASYCHVTGWVLNEWDDSVTMEVQGEPEQIERMLPLILQSHYISVERTECEELPLDPQEQSFRVRGD